MTKSNIIFTVLFILPFLVNSQTKITGRVFTENGSYIEGVNIVALNNDNILAYCISDSNGDYSISIKSDSDSITLQAYSINYSKEKIVLPLSTVSYNFYLTPKINKLKEVVLKAKPIVRKGDTLNYSVSSFKGKNDVKLIDVLSKMPGIEVLNNGKILYEGKAIEKYYIEGLDMLEGRYNLANANLSANSVATVQVLENHQPLKVLKNYGSDKASINIKLKNSVTTTGTANLGLGVSPLIHDMNFTPIIIAKNKQFLVSLMSNNIGDDISKQVEVLTIDELVNKLDYNTEKKDWVSLQNISLPQFNTNRFLFNNSNILSTNFITKLGNDVEFKFNASLLNDFSENKGGKNTSYFTPNDTIYVEEIFINKVNSNYLKTEFVLEKNTDDIFLKNKLNINVSQENKNGLLENEGDTIKQKVDIKHLSISNNLRILKPINNDFIKFNSFISYIQTPQTLNVSKVNNNLYSSQLIDLNTLYSMTKLGYTNSYKRLILSYEIGVSTTYNNLISNLTNATLPIENNITWFDYNSYIETSVIYEKGRFKLEVNIPINYRNYNIEENKESVNKNLSKIFFEPRIYFKYQLTGKLKSTLSYRNNNVIGNIDKLFFNPILKDYRTLAKYSTDIPIKNRKTYSAGLIYNNPLYSVFSHLYYNYSAIMRNTIETSSIDNSGNSLIGAINNENSGINHNISYSVNKYFSNINTSLKFDAQANLSNNEMYINNTISDVTSQSTIFKLKASSLVNEYFDVFLEGTYMFGKTTSSNTSGSFSQESITSNVNIYPSKNHSITFVNDLYFRDGYTSYFFDLSYKYKLSKEFKLELKWINIFNYKTFKNYSISSYALIESYYIIRPNQVMVSVKYSF